MNNAGLGVRAVLITMLMGIGQSGLRRMKVIDESLTDITGRRSGKLQLAREALALSNRNSRITLDIFLVQDKAQISMLLATKAENTENISVLMAEIASRCESEKEKQRLSAVVRARKPYVDKLATCELYICLSMDGNTMQRQRSWPMKHFRRCSNIMQLGTSSWAFRKTN
jgi:hypothetical protein